MITLQVKLPAAVRETIVDRAEKRGENASMIAREILKNSVAGSQKQPPLASQAMGRFPKYLIMSNYNSDLDSKSSKSPKNPVFSDNLALLPVNSQNNELEATSKMLSFWQKLKVSIKRLNTIFRSSYRKLRLIVRHLLPFLKAIAAITAIAKSLGFL